MNVWKLVWVAVVLTAGTGCAGGKMSAGGIESVGQWQRWDRAFTAVGEADGQQLELLVDLTAPSGAQRTVRGFWDGGDTWRVRFMPTELGRWTYRTSSRPAVAGLDGVSGSFEAVANAGGTAFLDHGPVGVSADGTHLEHADGTPFFWLVDTAWNGALLSRFDEWDQFLRDRADKRFTGVKFVMTQWRTAESNAEGEVAYRGFDEIEINPAFFERMDARIDAVNQQGLLAVPVLLWTLGRAEENPGQLPEAEAARLARYMVARYQANHVMFFLPGDGNYSGENAARWKRIGAQVFDLPGHPPAMLHPQGMQWPYSEWRDVDWLSVEAYQSGHGDDGATLRWIYAGPPAQYWDQEPVRPVINVEPPYEDHIAYQSRERHTAYTVRRAMYWSLLNAPTAGVSYGAHGVWSWQQEPGVPREHENTGEAKVWHEAMQLPGSTHAGHMARLFTSMDWWKLRPDAELVENPASTNMRTRLTHVLYTRDKEGEVAVYLDGERQGGRTIPGDFSNWEVDFRLALGDELVGDRGWKGDFRRVAIYDRPTRAAEAVQRFKAGPDAAADDALVLYTFQEGQGSQIRDLSGAGEPLDLEIGDPGAVEWLEGGGLRLHDRALISSPGPARKISAAVKRKNAITIEAWVAPENGTQAGPARIVTLSRDHGERNFTLGQDAGAYDVRLRTTETSGNGLPSTRTPEGAERHISASRTPSGDAAVVYLPLGGPVRVHPGALTDGVRADWFDPRDGSTRPAVRVQGAYEAPDDRQDWVLRFRE